MIICLPVSEDSHVQQGLDLYNPIATNETRTWNCQAKVDWGKEKYSSRAVYSENGQLEKC